LTVYVLRDGQMVDRDTGAPMLTAEERARPISLPQVRGDIPAYWSPLTGKIIEGRHARSEEMKRENVRELDPTEHKVKWNRPEWARAHGYKV
jgi:hypothetical protein